MNERTMQPRWASWRVHTGILVVLAIILAVMPLFPPGALESRFAPAAQVEPTNQAPEGGPVIVVLEPAVGFSAAASVTSQLNVDPQLVYGNVLDGFSADVTPQQAEALAADPRVAYVAPDLPVEIAQSGSYPTQITRVGADQNPNGPIGSGGTVNSRIAILDTGVNAHVDLNLGPGVNCSTSPGGTGDPQGHGTHVAGIAGAKDNGAYIVGTAPGATILPVKVLSDSGSGSLSNVICGLEWVASNSGSVDVVNLSLRAIDESGSARSCGQNDPMLTAICNVTTLGIPVVTAAGNDNRSTNDIIPARYDPVITVGAISDFNGQPGGGAAPTCSSPNMGADDTAAGYSNFGKIDVVAPGSCITSLSGTSGTSIATGTSMASPLVAGAIGTHLSQGGGNAKSWVTSAGSQSKTSSVGYTGSKLSAPILYLADTSPTPSPTPTPTPDAGAPSSGTANPSFSGTKQTVVSSTGSSNALSPIRVHDDRFDTSWFTLESRPPSAFFTLDLGSSQPMSGVRWQFRMQNGADHMRIETSTNGSTWQEVGVYRNGPQTNQWYGQATSRNARYVRFTFENPENRPTLGYISEGEIFGTASGASVQAQTESTPASTATPTQEATETPTVVPATPVPTDDEAPTPTATGEPPATPVATETVLPTGTEVPTPTATDDTLEPTETAEPTAEPTVTEEATEPPANLGTGIVSGAAEDAVNCRIGPGPDQQVVGVVPGGSELQITGAVDNGWVPVLCLDGQPGYISDDFLILPGEEVPEAETPAETAIPTDESIAPTEEPAATEEIIATEEVVEEPTAVPTETPIPVQRVFDSESSQVAANAVDGNPNTAWVVSPFNSPQETRLVLDLGFVQPIDRVSWETASWNTLPIFEIWLSEDGDTWWNLERLDGAQLQPDVEYEADLGFYARYLAIVIPNVDQSGLSEIGGFRDIRVWANPDLSPERTLWILGPPVTPTPAPTEAPPPEPEPTVVEEMPDEVVPVEPVEPEIPADEGGNDEGVQEEEPDPAPGD